MRRRLVAQHSWQLLQCRPDPRAWREALTKGSHGDARLVRPPHVCERAQRVCHARPLPHSRAGGEPRSRVKGGSLPSSFRKACTTSARQSGYRVAAYEAATPARRQHRRRHGSWADNGRLRHRQLVCLDHGSSGSRRPRSRLLVWWRVAGRSARDGVLPVRSGRLGGALVAVQGHAPGLAWRRGAGRRR